MASSNFLIERVAFFGVSNQEIDRLMWVPVWLRLAGGCVGCAEGSARAAGVAAADLAGRNRAKHSRLTAPEPMQSVLSHLLVTVAQSLMTQSAP